MKENRNISKEEWNALAQKAFGNLSADEEKALQKELQSLDATDLTGIEKTAEQINLHFKLKKFNSELAFEQIKSRVGTKQKRTIRLNTKSSFLKIAAVVVFALILSSVWFFSENSPLKKSRNLELIVQDYSAREVQLPDGSLVTLNRDSKISYPKTFTSDKREVFIEGEAFFEVSPNPEKPFIIHAGDATIRVLGTSFNVNAYPENERVEVVVATGKVQFYSEKMTIIPGRELILDPGDKGIFLNTSKELLKMHNQDLNFVAWKTRHLIFSETSLEEVIIQLKKLYQIQIETKGLGDLKYTGRFENQPLGFVLKVISKTLKFDIEKQEGCYIFKSKS